MQLRMHFKFLPMQTMFFSNQIIHTSLNSLGKTPNYLICQGEYNVHDSNTISLLIFISSGMKFHRNVAKSLHLKIALFSSKSNQVFYPGKVQFGKKKQSELFFSSFAPGNRYSRDKYQLYLGKNVIEFKSCSLRISSGNSKGQNCTVAFMDATFCKERKHTSF